MIAHRRHGASRAAGVEGRTRLHCAVKKNGVGRAESVSENATQMQQKRGVACAAAVPPSHGPTPRYLGRYVRVPLYVSEACIHCARDSLGEIGRFYGHKSGPVWVFWGDCSSTDGTLEGRTWYEAYFS